MELISNVLRLITMVAVVVAVTAMPTQLEKGDVKREIFVPRTGHCNLLHCHC